MKRRRLLLVLQIILIGLSGYVYGSGPTGAEKLQFASLHDYFFAAARSGETNVLSEFMKAGFPVNERNPQSYTALMIAAYQGQMEAVKLLLKMGANACLRDKRGHTALMGAIIKGEWKIAKILYLVDCDRVGKIDAKAPIANKETMSAAQFAEQFGQGERFRALVME